MFQSLKPCMKVLVIRNYIVNVSISSILYAASGSDSGTEKNHGGIQLHIQLY